MSLTGWDATKKFSITIDAADVAVDEVDYPTRLNIGASAGITALDNTAIFAELGASSLKIAIEDGDSGNQCYVEIEQWDSANLTAQLWIKVPAVSSTVDTVVNFYYDSAQADNTTYVGVTTSTPAQNVWDTGFGAVYHMAQDPSGTAPQILDSTANANHGTTYGTMTSDELVAGVVGKAISFNGAGQYIEVPVNILDTITTWTAEFFVNTTIASGIDQAYLWWYSNVYGFGIHNTGTNLSYWFSTFWGQEAVSAVNDGLWHYDCNKFDGTDSYHIFDTTAEVVNAGFGGAWPGTTFRIGERQDAGNPITAIIDEVRLSNVVRSANWIALTNLSVRDQLCTWASATVTTGNPRQLIDQLYSLTSDIDNVLEQIYSLRTSQSLGQVYSLTFDLLVTLEQAYGIKLVAYFKEYYGDSPVITAILRQYYNSSAVAVGTLSQAYQDAVNSRSSLLQDYSLLYALISFIKQIYPLADASVLSYLTGSYSIKTTAEVKNFINLFYSLVAGDSSKFQPIISISVDNSLIDFKGLSISGSKTQYCLSANIDLASLADYTVCKHLSDVIITINGQDFIFFVDKKSRSMDRRTENYTVSLLSPTAKLDSPYSKTIVDTLPDGAYAKTLVLAMAAKQGITVDYQIMDWYIPGHAISINDETPLSVIKRIARAVGGIIQTKPNGDLLIISDYPVSVPNWPSTTPAIIFDTAGDVKRVQEELDIRTGFNAFVITDQSSSAKSITLEEHAIDDTTKELRGFRVPFSDGEFPLDTSGGSEVSIESFSNYVETILPEVINDGDPQWEIVEFIDWKGSVSHPIYSIVDYEWIKDDLGAFQLSESGTLTIINQSAVPSESLLRIKYKTRYWKWLIHGPVNIPIQFYVPEISD